MTNGHPSWRSLLYVPVNVDRYVEKAHLRGADGIILDLEDRVPPSQKDAARKMVQSAAQKVARNGADVLVRINRELELAVRDIVHGREIKNAEALANPEALELYRDLDALRG